MRASSTRLRANDFANKKRVVPQAYAAVMVMGAVILDAILAH
jgi:hypothetical protein